MRFHILVVTLHYKQSHTLALEQGLLDSMMLELFCPDLTYIRIYKSDQNHFHYEKRLRRHQALDADTEKIVLMQTPYLKSDGFFILDDSHEFYLGNS